MHPTTINIDKLRQLVSQVTSRSSLRRLTGLGEKRLKGLLATHQIDTAHFVPYGKTNKRPIEAYLSNEHPLASDSLRRRLMKEGLKQRICEQCHNDTWLDQPIPLELHHVDGNHLNNALANLQVLCRNCHGLAGNHKGAARRRRKAVRVNRSTYIETIPRHPNAYEVCKALGLVCKSGNYETIYGIMAKEGLTFKTVEEKEKPQDVFGLHVVNPPIPLPSSEAGKERRRASEPRMYGSRKDAAIAKRKVVWPTQEELQRLVWDKPVETIADEYGVNGNSVRRWARLLEVALPPVGYWLRRHLGFTHEQALVSQKRYRKPLRRPTEEQAQVAYETFQREGTLRKAGQAIGFDHEVTRDAMIRFGLLPTSFRGRHGRPIKARKHE